MVTTILPHHGNSLLLWQWWHCLWGLWILTLWSYLWCLVIDVMNKRNQHNWDIESWAGPDGLCLRFLTITCNIINCIKVFGIRLTFIFTSVIWLTKVTLSIIKAKVFLHIYETETLLSFPPGDSSVSNRLRMIKKTHIFPQLLICLAVFLRSPLPLCSPLNPSIILLYPHISFVTYTLWVSDPVLAGLIHFFDDSLWCLLSSNVC